MARVESGVRAVKSILGDAYGEGYLAACLAALDLNPERVIEALLDNNPPQAVSHLSPQLAKIATVRGDNRRTGDVSTNEAKRQQKQRLRALEKQEQEDAALRDAVYDDDYDDRDDGDYDVDDDNDGDGDYDGDGDDDDDDDDDGDGDGDDYAEYVSMIIIMITTMRMIMMMMIIMMNDV